jgi:parallel beta-helix repeat protein
MKDLLWKSTGFFNSSANISNNQCYSSKDGIVIVATSETPLLSVCKDEHGDKFEQLLGTGNATFVRCLLLDCIDEFIPLPNFEFRTISKCYVEPIPYYVYGDKHAMIIPCERMPPRIIVVRSINAAHAARRQFYSMWDKATPLHSPAKAADHVIALSAYR